jgi:hypothetical protein
MSSLCEFKDFFPEFMKSMKKCRIRDEKMFDYGSGSGNRDEKILGSVSGIKHSGSETMLLDERDNK